MRLNQLPNFRVEDFASEQAWIGRMFNQLNPFVQAVNQVFDRNIDFAANIKSVTRDYSISTFQSFTFLWPFSDVAPVDLRITKATKGSLLTPTIILPAWSYDATQTLITVTNLLEVTASGNSALSGRYQFTLRATI